MKGEWCFISNFLSKETCNTFVEQIKTMPFEKPKLGFDGNSENNNRRKSKIRFLYRDKGFDWLFDQITMAYLQANDQFFGFHLSGFQFLQVAEYESTDRGEYQRHQDVFWLNGQDTKHRKLSGIIQLTDPNEYQGGDFQIYDVTQDPPANKIKEQGTFILFPSFLYHAALPVTSGTRFSIAVWVEGPKWV